MQNKRQRYLLHFLKMVNSCSRLKLAKIFFLIKQEGRIANEFKFYNFVPYKFGPYSFELFHDIERFENQGKLFTDEHFIYYLNTENEREKDSSLGLIQSLDIFYEKLLKLSETELIEFVYEKYPDYTIFSEIEQKQEYIRDRIGVFPIGYEGLSIDEFMLKLINEKVQVLIDVRDNPWSMKFGFKKHDLELFCDRLGMEYLSFRSLGIPGNFRKDLDTKEDYERLFKNYRKFIKRKDIELESLAQMANEKRIALMCFEKDPEYCHRTIIFEELSRRGVKIWE